MDGRRPRGRLFVTLLVFAVSAVAAATGPSSATELAELTTADERAFLMRELHRIRPPGRIRELSGYGTRQSELGGGFYGMLPEQLSDPDSIPVPAGEDGIRAAALCLARQRNTNLTAMTAVNPDYALRFGAQSLSEFLGRLESAGAPPQELPPGLRLILDVSALSGFFEAIADGEIEAEEAAALAELPSNQAMLEHRRNLGYVPEPLPDTDTLAQLIQMAGSSDPLDRLWCWINPQNAFGYADLVSNREDYLSLVTDFEQHEDRLSASVRTRIAAYVPVDTDAEIRFAFTVGWAIRGWATPEMAGLNLEQVKNDWSLLYGTLVEESFHRLQLVLCPAGSERAAQEFSELVAVDTGDPRFDRLYELIAYTVLEGSANVVRGEFAADDLPDQAEAGAELLSQYVRAVVLDGNVESAEEFISRGLKSNGPLYGLGWKLASLLETSDGKRAVGRGLNAGPVAFFLRATEISTEQGEVVVEDDVVEAVVELERRLHED